MFLTNLPLSDSNILNKTSVMLKTHECKFKCEEILGMFIFLILIV